MSEERFNEIKDMYWTWKETNDDMVGQEIFFALYDDRMISGVELDILMDQINL